MASLTSTMRAYQALSYRAIIAGVRRWHEVPKHHWAHHLIEQCRWGNPKWWWTYADEDFMGIIKSVCKSCTAGTAHVHVVTKVLDKWRLGWGLRLSRS